MRAGKNMGGGGGAGEDMWVNNKWCFIKFI